MVKHPQGSLVINFRLPSLRVKHHVVWHSWNWLVAQVARTIDTVDIKYVGNNLSNCLKERLGNERLNLRGKKSALAKTGD